MRNSVEYTVLNAKAATGIDKKIFVQDFKHVVLAIDTASSANLTIKIQGSTAEDAPDFTASQSATNQWDYVEAIDLEDGANIDGDTGITLSGTDDHRVLEVNTNGLNWITVNVTARSAGNVTVKATLYDNQ